MNDHYSGHFRKWLSFAELLSFFMEMTRGKRPKGSAFANLLVLVSCVMAVLNRQDNQTRNEHVDNRSTSSSTTTSAAALPPSGQYSSVTATEKWQEESKVSLDGLY